MFMILIYARHRTILKSGMPWLRHGQADEEKEFIQNGSLGGAAFVFPYATPISNELNSTRQVALASSNGFTHTNLHAISFR